MIDAEISIFDRVYDAVSPLLPNECFKSMYVPNPTAFPFATLYEVDNVTDTRHRSTSDSEEFAIVTYEANVFAEEKIQCRSIMDALDTAMTEMGFTRVSMQYVPNLLDPALFRLTTRYRAAVDQNNTIYRHI